MKDPLRWISYDDNDFQVHESLSDNCPRCGWTNTINEKMGDDFTTATTTFFSCYNCGIEVEKKGLYGKWLDSNGDQVAPQYEPMIQKLYKVAENYRIEIRYMPSEMWKKLGEINGQGYSKDQRVGSYITNRDLIILRDMDVFVIAHELGHVIDYRKNYDPADFDGFANADLLEKETRAWKYALEILHDIGFTEWDAFIDAAKECIDTYYTVLKNCSISGHLFCLELLAEITNIRLSSIILHNSNNERRCLT